MTAQNPVQPGHERLTARGLAKRYGGVVALTGADLTLRGGEVHALLGENGAGKSTLVRIIAGATSADAGQLRVNGQPVDIEDPRAARRHGIATVSQELNLFGDLDVLSNLFVHDPVTRSGFVSRRAMREAAQPHLEALGLGPGGLDLDLAAPLNTLTLAEQQLVEIARALIGEPAVLVLDEPTSALADAATQRLLTVIRNITQTGVAVLYVSHFLQEVSAIADRITVLRDGHNALTDEPSSGLSVDDMVAAMLGHAPAQPAPVHRADPADPQIPAAREGGVRIRSLTVPGRVDDVSLEVGPGEILGLAGLEGAGHTAVLEALWGRGPRPDGLVELPGRTSSRPPRSTTEALRAGIAFIPSDRKRLGLMLDKTVWENITSVWGLAAGRGGAVLRPSTLRAQAQRWVDELRIRATVDSPVSALSGGNQQKVVFAKWLQLEPQLIMLDDPTRGVDVGARAEMHDLVRDLAARGCSVLLCSTDLLELAELSARVLLMRRGKIVRAAEPAEFTEAGLVRALNTLAPEEISQAEAS